MTQPTDSLPPTLPNSPATSLSPLPVLGQAPSERADAARNRHKILTAAEEIIACGGMQKLSMNDVAAAAGVGVGTVYRRFGDIAGLITALMDERERKFQHDFMSGEPPLGPGAPSVDRIRAFLFAYIDRLDAYAMLIAIAEANDATSRYQGGPYGFHRTHLVALINEIDPALDATYLADALLAPLSAGLFIHHRHEQGMSTERIKAGLDKLITGTLGSADR